jgi:hypothetical protein
MPRDLDSPFLGEAPYAGAADERAPLRGTRLAALEALSPFTAYGVTAGQHEEHPSDPGTATADAFVADGFGKAYFATFSRLGDLTVRRATVLSPMHFENLIDRLLASDQRNFVIDAHGNPSGLHMPLTAGTKVAATKNALFMLSGIAQIRELMRAADEGGTIWDRASGPDLDRWRRIVGTMHSATWHRMIGDRWPRDVPAVDTVAAARLLIGSRLSALVDALLPGVAGRQRRVDTLVEKMRRLQGRGIRQIQFRACNIGKDTETLREFRRFFAADHLCAPDVRSGMGAVTPAISPGGVDALAARNPLAQTYELPSGRFAIAIDVSGPAFRARSAATSEAAVREWIAAHLMAGSHHRTGTFPLHFLETQPRAFALDPEYAAHIKCSSSFWEGAVRATGEQAETVDPDAPAAFEQQVGGAVTTVDPFPRHKYVLPLEMTNATFTACAQTVESDPVTAPMCGAVADLTGNPGQPAFFGHHPVDMLFVASLAKIYPMYVAFELRKRVEEQAKDMIRMGLATATAGWERQVFAVLEKAWKPRLRAAFPDRPEAMPKFADIFVLSPTGAVHFAENDPHLTDADLDFRPPNPTPGRPPISPEFKTPPGKFLDWMRLMLRWSNNEAASRCIRAIGFPYLNGVLGAAGFFDRSTRTGLWLSGDYLGHDWLPGDRAGQRLSPRWAALQQRKVTNFAGTSFQVARLLTLLAQGRLVDPDSSTAMLELMTGDRGIGSFILRGLTGATPPRAVSAIASKIGCGDEVPPPACGFTHDAAIVRVDRGADPARSIRYVAVALGGNPARGRTDLRRMAVSFHDCVTARHP